MNRLDKKMRSQWKKRLLRGFIALAAAGVLWVGYIQWEMGMASRGFDSDTKDAGIVLGAALWNDRPSPALLQPGADVRAWLADRCHRDAYVSRCTGA